MKPARQLLIGVVRKVSSLTTRVRRVSDIGLTGGSETPPLTSTRREEQSAMLPNTPHVRRGVRRILNGRS
ncbi:MAG: hypothetical protein LBK25_08750 [Treponema sp.]|nr:hypothetical protein [Treponema sp.]